MTTDNAPAAGRNKPARKLVVPALVTLAALAVLLNLGFWQLDRLAWKSELIERVEAGVTLPPVPAPGPDAWDGLSSEADYLRVSLDGRFQDGTAFYYTSLSDPVGTYDGPGLLVYSPLVTSDGWTVLVNRGFIPQGLADSARAEVLSVPEGPQRLTGLLRLSEKPNWTTPAPDPSDRIWFARDTGAMGEALDLSPQTLAPYSVDLDAAFTPETGLPQAGETVVRFKNDHLGYALTWFGLAATLIGVFLAYAAHILRGQPD
ncbi:MAG: SURF1 family protein [Roseibium sp.]|nr:SURF1 family protein [Roseibium sp.]